LKTITLFLALTAILFADAKVYMGSNIGFQTETYTNNVTAKSLSPMGTLKIGYGVREAYCVELALEYIDSKADSSTQDIDIDGKKYGLNVSFVKALDLDIYILPYAKVGFGTGFLEKTDKTSQNNRLNYSSYNIGTGFYIPMNENFDFELGYDYRYNSHEATDKDKPNVTSNKSHVNVLYFGFNVRF
jgi:opacity protein-like surface antigen